MAAGSYLLALHNAVGLMVHVSAHTASLLQVSEEARSKTVLDPGSLYFLKGQARTLSVMALLACIMKRGQHVKDAAWLLVTLGC